jgi:coiled-coil domain-containing protein 55
MGSKKDDMIIGERGITYGLQLRAPAAKPVAKKKARNIFGDDDDDDDDGGGGGDTMNDRGMVGNMIRQQAAAAKNDRKVLEMQAEALKQDAAIFDYDSHLDSIREARSRSSSKMVHDKVERRSKYITGLLETAEHRKKQQEVLKEKRLEKERAAEEHIYGTKEKFVTSAYRKKMEEEQKWKMEQEEKRKLEEDAAVEKKGHMGDFYRNLFKTNVDFVSPIDTKEPLAEKGTRGNSPESEEAGPPLLMETKSTNDDANGAPDEEDEIKPDTTEDEDTSRAERIKREREDKIKEAKERYLARKKHRPV